MKINILKNIIKEEIIKYSLNESDIITFGKYKGKTLEDVAKENSNYLNWIIDNIIPKNKEQEDFINKVKEVLSTLPEKNNKRNIKTIKLYIPNIHILKRIKTTPSLNQWFRSDLKVGDNIENVNHVQFHNIMKLFSSWDYFKKQGVTVEEIIN
jgi:uncharacterized protein (DUF3820 family)